MVVEGGVGLIDIGSVARAAAQLTSGSGGRLLLICLSFSHTTGRWAQIPVWKLRVLRYPVSKLDLGCKIAAGAGTGTAEDRTR